MLVVVGRGVPVIEQQLGEARGDSERRAHLVGRHAEELGLQLLGLTRGRHGPFALVDGGGHDHQAHAYDGDQGLQDLHGLGLGGAPDGDRAVEGARDAECGDQEDGGDGATLAEAQRGPRQKREEDIRVLPPAAEEDDPAHEADGGEQGGGLGELSRAVGNRWGSGPHEHEGGDDEGADDVAEPPEEPVAAVGASVGGARDQQRERPDGGAHRRCDERRQDDEGEHVARAREGVVEADPSQEVGGGHGLQRVPDGDAGGHPDRDAAGGVGHQRTESHRRPQATAEKDEGGDGQAGRCPDRCDHAVGDAQGEAELGRSHIDAGQDHNLGRVDDPPLRPGDGDRARHGGGRGGPSVYAASAHRALAARRWGGSGSSPIALVRAVAATRTAASAGGTHGIPCMARRRRGMSPAAAAPGIHATGLRTRSGRGRGGLRTTLAASRL